MNAEEFLDFEKIVKPFNYEGVNLWFLLRRRIFESTNHLPRYAKMRRNILFMRLLFFTYRFFMMVICRFLVGDVYRKVRVLITTRSRDFGTYRDLQTGKLNQGDIMYDSIIKELRERGISSVLLLEFPESPHKIFYGLRNLVPRLKQDLLVSVRYWSVKSWAKAYVWSKFFKRRWQKYGPRASSENLDEEVKYCFSCYVHFMIEEIEISKTILRKMKPELVVSWAWGGFRLAICLVSKNMKIPTVNLDYGTVIAWKELVSKNLDDLPDKICVALKVKYDFWLKRDIQKQKLEFTGSPYMDIVRIADRIYRRHGFCKKYGLNPSNRLILIVSGGISHGGKELVKETLKALNNAPHAEVLIKPRPNETVEEYEKIVDSKAKILPLNSDLFETMYVADLVVGYLSTAILEGVMLGTPAVSIYFKEDVAPYLSKYTRHIPYSQLGGVLELILSSEQSVMRDLRAKVRLYQMENKCDGRATERIANVIERMIK